jgi:hypothetical protein
MVTDDVTELQSFSFIMLRPMGTMVGASTIAVVFTINFVFVKFVIVLVFIEICFFIVVI